MCKAATGPRELGSGAPPRSCLIPLCSVHPSTWRGEESDLCREEMKSLHGPGSLTGITNRINRHRITTLFPGKTQRLRREQHAKLGAGARGSLTESKQGSLIPEHRLILAVLPPPLVPDEDPAFPSQGQPKPLVLSAYSFHFSYSLSPSLPPFLPSSIPPSSTPPFHRSLSTSFGRMLSPRDTQ